MTACYIQPGAPAPSPPPTQANSYVIPGSPQQPPSPSPQAPPEPPQAHHQDDPHDGTLLAEWRAHHGSDWVRADALHLTVRQLIDPKDRTPAIRQRLRQLVASCSELEAKVIGNAARPVTLYRMVGSKTA